MKDLITKLQHTYNKLFVLENEYIDKKQGNIYLQRKLSIKAQIEKIIKEIKEFGKFDLLYIRIKTQENKQYELLVPILSFQEIAYMIDVQHNLVITEITRMKRVSINKLYKVGSILTSEKEKSEKYYIIPNR